MLHLELGHNPNASARLTNKDFVRYEIEDCGLLIRSMCRGLRSVPLTARQRGGRSAVGSAACWRIAEQGGSDAPLTPLASPTIARRSINAATAAIRPGGGLMSPRTATADGSEPETVSFFDRHVIWRKKVPRCFTSPRSSTTTDTQNVRVYVETVSSIADPVAKATDAAWPLSYGDFKERSSTPLSSPGLRRYA